MADGGVKAGQDRAAIVIAVLAAIVFLALGGYFATIQNVWVDESTQLSGAALPFARMIGWLAGHPEPLGVPADRMPPVSYTIDALCHHSLCGSVIAFRWLHLLIAGIATAAIVHLAARRYGIAAAIVTAAFLVLTPQMLQTGVEIRAYPLFFACTILQLLLLYPLIERAPLSIPRLIGFALAGVLAIYTHFFGVISSSALFTGLIVARARSGRDLLAIGAAWALVLLSALGVAPFVMGATALSQSVESFGPPGAMGIVTFLLRVIGHSSMMLHPMLVATFCLALGALLTIAAIDAVRPAIAAPRAPAPPALAVFVALAAGLSVSILAAFVIHNFNPMKPSYSIWAVPLVALMAGAACASIGRRHPLGFAALAAATVMLAALAPMTIVFLSRAAWFVHGPEREISAQIDAPRRTAIVYVDLGWAYAYYPLVYRYHGAIDQYVIGSDGVLHPIGAGGDPGTAPVPLATLNRYDRLLLTSIQPRTYRDLRVWDAGYLDPVDTQAPSADLLGPAAAAWKSDEVVIRPGIYWLRLARLQRNDVP